MIFNLWIKGNILPRIFLGVWILYFVATGFSWARGKSEAEIRYEKALKAFYHFSHSRQIKYRRYWLRIISRFKTIYLKYPESKVAPKALFRVARLYEELYGYSGKKSDLKEALKNYKILWKRYPRSFQAQVALKRASQIYEKKLKDPVSALKLKRILRQRYPKKKTSKSKSHKSKKGSPQKTKKKTSLSSSHSNSYKKQKSPSPKGILLKSLRHWSSKDYSRVVIDLSGKISYKAHVLKPQKGKPPRLYVDCFPVKLSPYLKSVLPIKDGLLKQVRLGQYNSSTVRVVLDLKSLTHYKVFFLDEPPRLVIDLIGKRENNIVCPPPRAPISLAQQLGLCIRRIVIDPGHGGRDPGAKGRRGLREKDVVLKVSKLLAQKLKKRLGCDVFLTRSRDIFIPLEQRTAIANMKHADLFISIHVNSSPQRRARGIETYYLNFATDKEAMRVAALENAASTHSLSEIQDLLKNILLNSKVEESSRLAKDVQKELIKTLRSRYRKVKDRGVRTAPFVVLIGTRMPAILVEIGFISNRYEEKYLRNPRYLQQIAEGLAKGIEKYIREMKNPRL